MLYTAFCNIDIKSYRKDSGGLEIFNPSIKQTENDLNFKTIKSRTHFEITWGSKPEVYVQLDLF